ncbi:MAG: TonB-dependent receptor [Candidatus Solibacter sp.]|nr:TonB-dependent receptor [Candidatus Solibacter sp.]
MKCFRSKNIALSTMALLALGGWLGFFSASLPAQSFFGSIVGTVTDASGAAVPEAAVALTNAGTGERRSAQTDGNGNYQFVNLVPGSYKIDIARTGFKHLTRDGIQVQVQASVRIDAAMQVGEVTQTLEVNAQTPLLQTEQSALSQVVEGRTMQEMPLNGRNVLNLVSLVAGVVPQGSTSGNPMGNQGGGATTNPNGWGNYQIGGGQANQSASFFDGAPLNVSYVNSVILVPTQDAVQEFRVATNSVSPEFGRFAGGVVNMAGKSGTNQFHGSLYEYFRNKVLNANNFFNNRSGIARPSFNQNQYGASIGGPVRKDKTFFAFTWEDFKLRVGLPTVTTVPTAAMRAGDFNAAGIPTIYDPLTVCGNYSNAACGKDASGNNIYLRQPFPNKQIPLGRINSEAKIMNDYWGLPNAPGVLNNFVTNGTGGGDNYQINARGDHMISDKQRLFLRYSRWLGNTIPNDLFHNLATANQQRYSTNNAVVGDTYTLTPTTILDVRASYIRFLFGFYPPDTGVDLAKWGPGYALLNSAATFRQTPTTNVTPMQTFSRVTVRNASNNQSLSETLTRIAGRHTLKVGAESRKIEWNYGQTNFSSGQFTFTTAFTSQNAQSPAGSGYAMASYLLGYMATGHAQEIAIASQRQWYHGLFIADTFQVTNKLTLNLGLRWDYPGSFSERHDAATVLLPNTADALGKTAGLPINGTVALVNSDQYPSRLIHPAKWNLIAPRLGLAYRLNDKTVVRAGYGLSYLPNDVVFGNAPWTTPANQATTVVTTSLDGGITPYATLDNPFPNGVIQPPGHNSAFASGLYGSNVQSPVPDQPFPYVQQWNFMIQRQLPGGAALEAGYAGSKGTHLPLNPVVGGFPYFQVNQIPDSYLSMGNALLAKVTNPFYGKVPATAGILAQPTVTQGQLLRPMPQYLNVNNTSNMAGDSTYHSLQTKLEKRFGAGGTLLAVYTFAKLLGNADTATSWLETGAPSGTFQDWNNTKLEKSLGSYNTSHRGVISYVLDLPMGKGRKLLGNVTGIADKVVSGWGINGTTTLQSGFPIVLTAQATTLSSTFGGGAPRPNYVGGCEKSISGTAQSRIGGWFNAACFTQPGPFAYGNEARTDPSLRAAGINNFDVSISKTTAFTERMKARFETQFFNIANRTQFSPPAAILGNAGFSTVTAVRNQPRLVQFALRLTF